MKTKISLTILLTMFLVFCSVLTLPLSIFAQDSETTKFYSGVASIMKDVELVSDIFFEKHSRWPTNSDIQEMKNIAHESSKNGDTINLDTLQSIEVYPQSNGDLEFVCFTKPDYNMFPSNMDKSKIAGVKYEFSIHKEDRTLLHQLRNSSNRNQANK